MRVRSADLSDQNAFPVLATFRATLFETALLNGERKEHDLATPLAFEIVIRKGDAAHIRMLRQGPVQQRLGRIGHRQAAASAAQGRHAALESIVGACGAFHACRIVDADRRRIGNEPREHEHPDPAFAYAISAILELRDRAFDIVFA